MGGGTEAFTDLGSHCEQDSCHQLDFLPFNCEGCQKVFCLEHRSFKAHNCPKADYNSRIVVVCETCSASMEKKAGEDVKAILEKHKQSGECDPAKKHKPKCPVKRCKEKLTFSNTTTCKTCHQKVCLKHRFPAEHACKPDYVKESKFLLSLAARSGTDCRGKKQHSMSSTSSPPSVKAC